MRMSEPTIRNIAQRYLSDDKDIDKFLFWAWGESYKDKYFPQNSVKLWNEKHSDKLVLKEMGSPWVDIPQMIDIWKKNIQ